MSHTLKLFVNTATESRLRNALRTSYRRILLECGTEKGVVEKDNCFLRKEHQLMVYLI